MSHYLIYREPIPAGAEPVQCQYTWRDGCYETATWRVSCGPDTRFYCDSHEGPPCGGVFLSDFKITAGTARKDVVSVFSCGSHRIHSPSGRDIYELSCCSCGEWIGDTEDPEIKHVSIPLRADCRPMSRSDSDEAGCRACDEMMADMSFTTPPGPS